MAANIPLALDFIRNHASRAEQARLAYILSGECPAGEALDEILAGQRPDGGWAPYWAPDYSGLDATCYRLAQAEQGGVPTADASFARAAEFLTARQAADGSWEEDASLAASAPPWARPGDAAARLYLTANCGFWLAVLAPEQPGVARAARLLAAQQDLDGRLPTFLHAHWLAAGLWQRLGQHDLVDRGCRYLVSRIPDMPASSLAWMITTLGLGGLPAGDARLKQAADRLAELQRPDGRWASEDGPERDVHASLEALRALRLAGKF
jgi:hypothetical protein